MKRLLRRKKRGSEGHRAEECTRTLHLDTAFTNKGFDDMDKVDKGGALLTQGEIYSFTPWRTNIKSVEESTRWYGAKIDAYKYATNGYLKANDARAAKAKQESRRVVFKETSLIGTNYKEKQIMVEMQVRNHEYAVAKKDRIFEWTDNNAGNKSACDRKKPLHWSKEIADDVAKENSAYRWKAKVGFVKFPTVPDRSFGIHLSTNEGKHDKNLNGKSERRDYQPYLQNLGGQMSRCISLPTVAASSSFINYSSYNTTSNDDVLSISDVGTEDIYIDRQIIPNAVESAMEGKEDRDNCGNETSSSVAPSHLEHHQKGMIETTYETSSDEYQNCDSPKAEETNSEYELTKDSQTNEEKQENKEGARANTNTEFDKNVIEQCKQNSSESERDPHGNDELGAKPEAGITPSKKISDNDIELVIEEQCETSNGLIQKNNAVQLSMEVEKVVCGCISDHSKPPAVMKKMPCTCMNTLRSENHYEIDHELSCISDEAQQVMKNNKSRKQRLEERVLITPNKLEHSVQINCTEKHSGITRRDSSASGKVLFDIESSSSSEVNDTWSFIPLTVQYGESSDRSLGELDREPTNTVDTSQIPGAASTSFIGEVTGCPSPAESTIIKKVNMQEIELRLGAKSTSFHEEGRARSVEVDLGEDRPASRHASTLDKLSGMLQELKHKRKRVNPPRNRKYTAYAGNNEQESSGKDIEMVEMRANNNTVDTDKIKMNCKRAKADKEEDEVPLDSSFILEGAKEAEEQLNVNKERLKKEMLKEESKLKNLLNGSKLSHRKRYTLILVLWAIEAEMPEEFFDSLRKSRMLNALVSEQIGTEKELILQNMYTNNVHNS